MNPEENPFKFPNPNEEQNDQVLEPEVLDAEPKKEVFPGFGKVDSEALRKQIEETLKKDKKENPN